MGEGDCSPGAFYSHFMRLGQATQPFEAMGISENAPHGLRQNIEKNLNKNMII